MKKFLSLTLIFILSLVTFSADAFKKSFASNVSTKSIDYNYYKNIYTNYINNELKSFKYLDKYEFKDAYMLDVNNDSIPELVSIFDMHVVLFEYSNGKFKQIENIELSYSGGGSAGSSKVSFLKGKDNQIYIQQYSSWRQYGSKNDLNRRTDIQLVIMKKNILNNVYMFKGDEDKNSFSVNNTSVFKNQFENELTKYYKDLESNYSEIFAILPLQQNFHYGSQIDKYVKPIVAVEDKFANYVGEYKGSYTYSGEKVGMDLKIYKSTNGQYKGTLNTYKMNTSVIIGTYDLDVSYDSERKDKNLILKGNKITKASPASSIYLEGYIVSMIPALKVTPLDPSLSLPQYSTTSFSGNLFVNGKSYPFGVSKSDRVN